MEIRSYYCYIIVNCVILFPSLLSKPVSLNDIIAAEEKSTSLQTPQLKISETRTNIRQLPKKDSTSPSILTRHTSGYITHTSPAKTKISPLQYKKTFQIRAPLRPKKIKYSFKPRKRRINATKREIENDERFNKNYIPLLRSLSILFNNILGTDSGTDDTTDEHNRKRQSFSRNEECSCARVSADYKISHGDPAKTATTVTSSIAPKIPTKAKTIAFAETSSTSAYNTFNDNFSPLRWHKDLPILSTRNTISSRRDHNGFRERSLSTYNRNFEGHIAGNNGSNENNNSGRKTTESYTENYEQYTDSGPGDYANCDGACGGIGRNRNITSNTTNKTTTVETFIDSDKTFKSNRGNSNKFKGFDKFESRRNETESQILLSQSSSRLRGFESQEESAKISSQIPTTPEESIFDLPFNIAGNQRISYGDGPVAEEDQEIRRSNQKLTLDEITTSLINASNSNLSQDKQKIVVIYDGYSVARDVNGENKLSEKAYRIHS